jgi:hypothetical protein
MGHYPMLERPDEFNKHVAAMVEELSRQPQSLLTIRCLQDREAVILERRLHDARISAHHPR